MLSDRFSVPLAADGVEVFTPQQLLQHANYLHATGFNLQAGVSARAAIETHTRNLLTSDELNSRPRSSLATAADLLFKAKRIDRDCRKWLLRLSGIAGCIAHNQGCSSAELFELLTSAELICSDK